MIVCNSEHPICDTVARALVTGFGHNDNNDVAIGYGILRGVGDNLRKHDRWFHVDRGYFDPGHFEGYYRISYKGTQAKWHENGPMANMHCILPPKILRKDWALICPPTDPVCQFFGINLQEWIDRQTKEARLAGYLVKIRNKDCEIPLIQHFQDVGIVITFNSSVGWRALQLGIPCLSDVNHSVVGSYYGETVIEKLLTAFYSKPREELLCFMGAHDFTLREIAEGKAWNLINHYLSGSVGTQESPSAPMLQSTALKNGQTLT